MNGKFEPSLLFKFRLNHDLARRSRPNIHFCKLKLPVKFEVKLRLLHHRSFAKVRSPDEILFEKKGWRYQLTFK